MIEKVFSILEQDHQPTMLEELGNYTLFQMLIMTMLSSRTKDSTTIPIVKEMFAKYPQPEDFVDLDVKEIEKLIYGIGFFRVKARNIKKLSMIILSEFEGRVPETFEKLVSLPGVGRKTANCILAYTFGKPAIAVDIHVHVIANRLGWVDTKTPEKTEYTLRKIIPKKLWRDVNRLFVSHGQNICLTQKPKCLECKIKKFCEYREKSIKVNI